MFEVYTGRKAVAQRNMFARVSQCVAVGTIDSAVNIGGIAHIHVNDDYEEMLEKMFLELLAKGYQAGAIYIAGGSNAFVPGYGPVFGERKAERVYNYVSRNLKGTDIVADVGGDAVRQLLLFPRRRKADILRIEEY
jgi:chemotaxis receptor (MCP) glutamine deamidase CheD